MINRINKNKNLIKFLCLVCVQTISLEAKAQDKLKEESSHRNKEIQVLTELVIKADPFNHTVAEHTSPVSLLKKEDIIKKSETTIAETIANEPGVSTSYSGPGASRPIIRGFSNDRVRVLKNGIGSLDVSNFSEDHAVTISPLSAESIEILRGPETLLYGSSAIGGVVNVTDNSIPETAIGRPISGAVDFRTQTADKEKTGAFLLEGQAGKFNWHLDGFYQDTNDINIPDFAESDKQRELEAFEHGDHEDGDHGAEDHDEEESEEARGRLPNSATSTSGATAGGSYVWDKGYVGISVNGFKSKYRVPGDAHEEEDYDHDEEEGGGVVIDMKQVRVDIRGEVREVNDFIEKVKFNLGGVNYQHKELEGSEVATKFENDAIESRGELVHSFNDNLNGVLGAQVQYSDFNSVGEEAFIPQTDTFSPAIFLFEEYEINNKVKLQFGGRYEHVSLDAQGVENQSFNPMGVSTGISWDITGKDDYNAGISFAFTQRAPSTAELYAAGPHLARGIAEFGSTDIDLEKSVGVDFTLRKNTGLVTGVLNLFYQDFSNYINLSNTGGEVGGLPSFNYNEIDANYYGFEAQSSIHLHEMFNLWVHDIDFNTQVDFVRAQDETNNEDIPRIPPLRTIVGLDYGYKNLSANVQGVFVQGQNRVSEDELQTDDYQLLNTSLNYTYNIDEDMDLIFFLRGTNLTNREARVHSSFFKDIAPLRGRSFLFGVRATF